MTAVFVKNKKPFNGNYRRDKGFYKQYTGITIDPQTFEVNKVLELRLYLTKSRVYACFWLHSPHHLSGSDFASGSGYDKEEAAAWGAMYNAGISFKDYKPDTFSQLQAVLDLAYPDTKTAIITAHP